MLTRLIKTQLVLLVVLAVAAVLVLGWYFLRIPSLVGVGRYTLYAELPQSGGLYRTANVTYRGITIGKVTNVEPTQRGARATMSIDNGYQIPTDASANVHSVSAVGEQYLDLVSTRTGGPYLQNNQTITKSTVPSQIGPALDAANRGLAVLPKDRLWVGWDRRFGAWSTPPRESATTSGAASTTSTTSSRVRHPSSTARSIPVTTLGIGLPTSTPWPHRPRSRIKRFVAFWPAQCRPPIRSTPRSATCRNHFRRRWPISRS